MMKRLTVLVHVDETDKNVASSSLVIVPTASGNKPIF